MNSRCKASAIFILSLSLLVSGCGSGQLVGPTITPMPTLTSTPTFTPTSTPTFTPTLTLTQTPSPTPTIAPPEILSQYLTGVKILNVNTFDSMDDLLMSYNNIFLQAITIQDGELKINGQNYQGGMQSNEMYGAGKGILYDFKILSTTSSSDFEFETYFGNNQQWMTNGYRRFGIFIKSTPATDFWIGKNGFVNYLSGNLTIKPDIWYRLVLATGNGGDFLCEIWDPKQPDKNSYFHELMGKNWSGLDWIFVINGARGDMVVDNIMDISFNSMK